jgi:hypothetical protein
MNRAATQQREGTSCREEIAAEICRPRNETTCTGLVDVLHAGSRWRMQARRERRRPTAVTRRLVCRDRSRSRGRALTPAFKHNVTAEIRKRGSDVATPVWLSEEDSLDQPFVTQYSSTSWPHPNVLQFHGSLATQSSSDELVIENRDDRPIRCVKVFTTSNYDVLLAFDIQPKSRHSLAWRSDPASTSIYSVLANATHRVGLQLSTGNLPGPPSPGCPTPSCSLVEKWSSTSDPGASARDGQRKRASEG